MGLGVLVGLGGRAGLLGCWGGGPGDVLGVEGRATLGAERGVVERGQAGSGRIGDAAGWGHGEDALVLEEEDGFVDHVGVEAAVEELLDGVGEGALFDGAGLSGVLQTGDEEVEAFFGGHEGGNAGEGIVAGGEDLVGAEMFDEGIEAFVPGDEVVVAVGVVDGLPAEFGGEDKIEGVFARQGSWDELDLVGVVLDLGVQRLSGLLLLGAENEVDLRGLVFDAGEVGGVDVFVVDEDVVGALGGHVGEGSTCAWDWRVARGE